MNSAGCRPSCNAPPSSHCKMPANWWCYRCVLAAEAGVKLATLLRLAQRLGYRGWSELKSDFIDDLGLRNDTYVSKAEKMMARGTQTQLYKEVFQAHQANLTFTQNENAQEMEQAVTLLDSAENVYICGFRASFPIAWSLFYVYRLFNRQVSLIDGLASNIEVFTRELTNRDCVLLTSFAPYSRESLDVLRAARQAGAKILAITDSPVSPLAQAADCTLLFSIDSPSFFLPWSPAWGWRSVYWRCWWCATAVRR